MGERSLGHGDGDVLADSAAFINLMMADAEQFAFGLIAIYNETAIKSVTRAFDIGE
ncbi:hypothetical protein SBA_ch1_28710 [Sphingomonas bisphenolicum]|uniref:Uncharacterized protein n=1 Tax=Sphingomonas bisphenolicum TaxID=296544 RepID=A0ABM7FZW7_9SPHN|nr:hypothetical protein SBA_ch1_28710 [Sphingomonas bisphenolicum]